MGVIARQSIKGALANYLGVAIGFVTTFFVLTRCLTQEEIGLTRVMVDAALLFSCLAQLGTNSSIIRFFPFFKEEGKGNHGIFGWSVLIPFVGFVLFAVIFFLFREPILGVYMQKSPLIADYFYLLIPLTFFALYLTVFETNASVLMRITVPKLVREVGIRVFNLISYILYGKGVISLDLFVVLFCASYGLAMLLNLCYLLSLGQISFRIDWKFIDRSKLKEIVRYTLFMTATVLAGNIPLINSLFLGAKTGLALTGVYTIASYIANVVEVPYRSLGAISRPVISQAVRENNWGEVNRLAQQVALHQLLMSCLIFFFIYANLGDLFSIIPNGTDYAGGIGVVLILGGAKIANSSLSVGTDILNYSRYYPVALLLIGVLTFSAILFNPLLIDFWSINGSACATLFSYLLYFALLLTFLWKKLRVNLIGKGCAKVLLLIGILLGANALWNLTLQSPLTQIAIGPQWMGALIDALLRSIVLLAIALPLMYRLRISSEVNRLMEETMEKIKKQNK